jgi:hypothetical protein
MREPGEDGARQRRGRDQNSGRIEPISLSAYPFCQGDRAETGRSRMPMARMRRMKAAPYATSRSRISGTEARPSRRPWSADGQAIPHWDGLSHPATEARGVTVARYGRATCCYLRKYKATNARTDVSANRIVDVPSDFYTYLAGEERLTRHFWSILKRIRPSCS